MWGNFADKGNRAPAIAVVVLFFVTGSVLAQVTASITGTVKDSSSAVVPAATITVKHLESGLSPAEAPMVNTTLSPTSGLVGEKEVKDLPLNGRQLRSRKSSSSDL